MSLQQTQLDSIAGWLTIMEDRIKKQSPIGPDIYTVQAQIIEHQVLDVFCMAVES